MFNCIDGAHVLSNNWQYMPLTQSSDFGNHSYDYRRNWTPLSPVSITNNNCHKIYCTNDLFLLTPLLYRHFSIMDISLRSSNANFIHLPLLYNTDTSVVQTPGSVPPVSILKMFPRI